MERKLRNETFDTLTMDDHVKVAKPGGNAAKVAKETLEQETGKPVITSKNAFGFSRLIEDIAKKSDDDSQVK